MVLVACVPSKAPVLSAVGHVGRIRRAEAGGVAEWRWSPGFPRGQSLGG